MRAKPKNSYAFAVLEACDNTILNIATPMPCRLVICETKGGEMIYHASFEGSDSMRVLKNPVFTKIVGAPQHAVLGSEWRENMAFTLSEEKLKYFDDETTAH